MVSDILLTFGKHNGKHLSECPRDYVEWLATLGNCKQPEVPTAAKAYLETAPDTRSLRYGCPRTIDEAEKLSWMAGKGNREAARTLLHYRNKDNYIIVDYEDLDGDEVFFYVYDNGTGYCAGEQWEIEERKREEEEEAKAEAYKEAHPDLEWMAQSGQRIKIWVDEFYPGDERDKDMQIYLLSIDGVKKERMIEPIPAKQRAWAKQNGIVAVLGPVGLTAERKALLEAKAEEEKIHANG